MCSSDLKELGLNVSEIAENALSDRVKRTLEENWRKENADAIEAYNERVDRNGMYIDDLRQF